MNRLIIMDYFLAGSKGHEENYDFSVASEALRQGVRTEVWCHKLPRGEARDFVKECLESPPCLGRGLIWKVRTAFARALEIRKLFQGEGLNDDVLILIPTVDSHFLLSLMAGTVGLKILPKVIIVIRRSLKDKLITKGYLKKKIKEMAIVFPMRRLYAKGMAFFSDSEMITEELRSKGLRTAETLPIPHLPRLRIAKQRGEDNLITFLGGARFEKGFDLLPGVMRTMLESGRDVRFLVQTSIFENTDRMLRARDEVRKLRSLYPDRVTIVEGYLSNAEYTDCLNRSSIMLIPYRKEFYNTGTSGILAEAIACGVWAVVPEGTWMAAQKAKYGKIATFADHSVDAITCAVSSCAEREATIDATNINNQIGQWYSEHSPGRYLERLLR